MINEKELEHLENESQQSMDNYLLISSLVICSCLMFKDKTLYSYAAISCFLLCVFLLISSHYVSTLHFRKYNEYLHYNKNKNFNVKNAIKIIQLLNFSCFCSFAVGFIFTCLIFNTIKI